LSLKLVTSAQPSSPTQLYNDLVSNWPQEKEDLHNLSKPPNEQNAAAFKPKLICFVF
jgi:hypothetical protein